MAGEIIPFGKYKGQPIEAIASDKQYLDWLTQQPWFREKYATIHQVIINNFCEPTETPEHNALQAKFLDDDFRLKFASIAFPRLWWYARMDGEMIEQLANEAVKARSRVDSYAAKRNLSFGLKEGCRESRPRMSAQVSDLTVQIPQRIAGRMVFVGPPSFEKNGVDCEFGFCAGARYYVSEVASGAYTTYADTAELDARDLFRIEIKPNVGDDYPAVLRQMRGNHSTILFTRSYCGDGVDEATFFKFMESQGIKVILESDVDAAEKIRVDEFDAEKFLKIVKMKRELENL